MANYGLPKGMRMMSALGKIALRHGQLENSMKMVIKDLAGVEKQEALDATAMQNSRELRERIRKLAKQRIGEGPALVQLDALLHRAKLAADKRNELLHSTWGTDSEVGAVMRDAHHIFKKAPTAIQLEETVEEIEALLDDIVTARLKGFLKEALKNKSRAKPQE